MKKMSKTSIIILVCVFTLFLHLAYTNFLPWNEKVLERKISENILKELHLERRRVELKSVTPFVWTEVCLIQSIERYWPEINGWNINDELSEIYHGYIPPPSCDGEQNDLFFINNGVPVANIATNLCVQIPLKKSNSKTCFDQSAELVFTNSLKARNPNQPVYIESAR